MTKPTGTPRGPKPQNDGPKLDRMAELFSNSEHIKLEFDTATRTGGKITRSLSGASRQVAKELNGDDRHDGNHRKRLSRKYGKELKAAPMSGGPDEQNVPFYPREERVMYHRQKKHHLFPAKPENPKT